MGTEMVRSEAAPTGLEDIQSKVRSMLRSGYLKRWTEYKQNGQVVRKKEDAAVADVVYAIMTARELGVPDLFFLRHGYVTPNGDVSMDSHVLMAIYTAAGGHFEVLEESDEKAVVRFYDDEGHEYVSSYSVADAKRAGLTTYKDGKPKTDSQWIKNPRNQCLRQAFARGARTFRPDLMAGMYEHSELGLRVKDAGKGDWADAPLDVGENGVVDLTDVEELEPPAEYEPEPEEQEEVVTTAEIQAFRAWCEEFRAEIGVKAEPFRRTLHELLAEMGKSISDLTMAQLDVLQDQIRNHTWEA